MLFMDHLAVEKLNEELVSYILVGDGISINHLVVDLKVLSCKLLTAIQIDINRLLVLDFVSIKLLLDLWNVIELDRHFLVQQC